MRLSEAINLFISHYGREGSYTCNHYLQWFLDYLKNPKVTKITPVDVVRFQDSLTCSPSVKEQIAIILRSLFRYLNRYHNLNFDAEKIEIPQYVCGSYKRISADDLTKLYKSINPSTLIGLRNLALCKTLYDTGCRASEVCNLGQEIADSIEIVGAKFGKKRTVFLTKETQTLLKKYLSGRTDALPWMFVSHPRYVPPRKFNQHQLTNLIRKLGNNIGIPCHPHMFRKALATDLTDKSGGNITMVKEILGHASIKTTELYVKYDQTQVKRFYQKYRNKNEELEFTIKNDGEVMIELKGWARIKKTKQLRRAIQRAIDEVLT